MVFLFVCSSVIFDRFRIVYVVRIIVSDRSEQNYHGQTFIGLKFRQGAFNAHGTLKYETYLARSLLKDPLITVCESYIYVSPTFETSVWSDPRARISRVSCSSSMLA